MNDVTQSTWHQEYKKSSHGRTNEDKFRAKHTWIMRVMADDKLRGKASAKNVAWTLMFNYFNSSTGQCNPSIDSIAADIGLSRRAAQEAMQQLVAAGYVSLVVRSGTSNQHVLNRIAFPRASEVEPMRSAAPLPMQSAAWGNAADNASPMLSTASEPITGTEKESSKETLKKEEITAVDGDAFPENAFEQFWSAYPKKVARSDTQAAFAEMISARTVSFGALMSAVRNYVRNGDDKFRLNPVNYIRGQRWTDETPKLRSRIRDAI